LEEDNVIFSQPTGYWHVARRLHFYFKAPLFIIHTRTFTMLKSYLLATNI